MQDRVLSEVEDDGREE